jgi:sarcosine oxidase subunit gamma|tara:strand:+ start:278 stop:1006 length:729 start_codon:yes stop_codon:yes gene_type:complete
MATLDPTSVKRRSPLKQRHITNHALFKEFGGNLLVGHYGNNESIQEEHSQAQILAICDLSTLPRIGFKGPGAPSWLETQKLKIPTLPNTAECQHAGSLVAKLSDQEVLILSDIFALSNDVATLSDKAEIDHHNYDKQTYILPRGDSHCWLAVTGTKASEMFSKICGVDLRTHKFAQGEIAQTSIAKTNAVVIRNDLGGTPGFYILSDISGVEFLWDCLLDAMHEYGGYPIGFSALQRLIKSS